LVFSDLCFADPVFLICHELEKELLQKKPQRNDADICDLDEESKWYIDSRYSMPPLTHMCVY
jgi:hypothetical protein